MLRRVFVFAVLVATFAVTSGVARADDILGDSRGDPAEGLALAEQWCAGCHAIAPGRASGEQAPDFESIVGARERSDAWIRTWLSTPHQAMPDLSLSRNEIAALLAYLASLRPGE